MLLLPLLLSSSSWCNAKCVCVCMCMCSSVRTSFSLFSFYCKILARFNGLCDSFIHSIPFSCRTRFRRILNADIPIQYNNTKWDGIKELNFQCVFAQVDRHTHAYTHTTYINVTIWFAQLSACTLYIFVYITCAYAHAHAHAQAHGSPFNVCVCVWVIIYGKLELFGKLFMVFTTTTKTHTETTTTTKKIFPKPNDD